MVDVAAGGAHSACVTAAGDLYTWGKGRYGRLGHSDSEDQLKPKLVRRSFAWEVWRDSLPLSLSFFKNKKYKTIVVNFQKHLSMEGNGNLRETHTHTLIMLY